MKPFSIFIVLFMISSNCYALTLEDLRAEAVANREIVEKYKANLEIKEDDVEIAKSRFLPEVNVSYTATAKDEASSSEAKEGGTFRGSLTWNLFAGFRDKYSKESAELLRQAESYKLDAVKQDIQLNVSLFFLAVYDRKAGLKVAEDTYANLLKTYKDAENRYQVGLINKNDLLKIKVDLDNSEIGLKKAQAALTKSVRNLSREIDRELALESLEFNEFENLPQPTAYEVCEKQMLEARSEIRVLEHSLEASELAVGAEKARLYPQVDLTSSYSNYDGWSDEIESDEVRHQLTVSMNLFDGFGKYKQINKAKRTSRTIRYDLEELKKDLQTELMNLFIDYEVSSENLAVAEGSIVQAEENLRITKLSQEEGLSTTSDLLDAITSLSRARYNFVAAKVEIFSNYFKITRALEGFAH